MIWEGDGLPDDEGLHAPGRINEPALRSEVAHAIYAEQGWAGWVDLKGCTEAERAEWAEVGVWSEADRPEHPAPPMAWIEAVRISANPQPRSDFRSGVSLPSIKATV